MAVSFFASVLVSPQSERIRAYNKVGPLGSSDKRCVIDYDELYELLNKPGSRLAETFGRLCVPYYENISRITSCSYLVVFFPGYAWVFSVFLVGRSPRLFLCCGRRIIYIRGVGFLTTQCRDTPRQSLASVLCQN